MSQRVVRGLLALALVAGAAGVFGLLRSSGPRPLTIVFVHGMGGDAREIGTRSFTDLLGELARRYPRENGCQRAAQPDRPWEGSPCVFRYVDDVATGGASHSGVEENAAKLADEVEEIEASTGDPVVLVGFSMGGAIVRAYLATHRQEAERNVEGVVLLHGAVHGSWLLAGTGAVERFTDSPVGDLLERAVTAVGGEVDRSPDAIRDLTPGSPLMERLAGMPLPRGPDYTTLYGDITVRVDTPGPGAIRLPSVGDVILLPGEPAADEVQPLGGQRLSPTPGSIEVRHTDQLDLGLQAVQDLGAACLSPAPPSCRQGMRDVFDSPSAHWRVPESLGTIQVEESELGGGTLLELIVRAVGRSQPATA